MKPRETSYEPPCNYSQLSYTTYTNTIDHHHHTAHNQPTNGNPPGLPLASTRHQPPTEDPIMNPSDMTENDIMLGIWREAGRSEDGVTIPCESVANATRLRFALYNALKPIKAGKQVADSALLHAIKSCSLSFTEDKLGLVVRPKVATVLGKSMLAALAGKGVKTVEEYLLEESAARIMGVMAEPEKVKPATSDLASLYGARN